MINKYVHIVLSIEGQDNYDDIKHAEECLTEIFAKAGEDVGSLLDWRVNSIYPPLIGKTQSLGVEVSTLSISLFLGYLDLKILNNIIARLPEEYESGLKRRRCKKGYEEDILRALLKSL